MIVSHRSYTHVTFFKSMCFKYLKSKDVKVVFELEPNLDIIFTIDPRKGRFKKYGIDEILQYKKTRHFKPGNPGDVEKIGDPIDEIYII